MNRLDAATDRCNAIVRGIGRDALKTSRRQLLTGAITGAAIAASGPTKAKSARRTPALLAPRPPMGWNSWNSFGPTINEAQARETAAIMAKELLPFGYDIFTIDIQWYEPEAKSYTYNSDPIPAMDE